MDSRRGSMGPRPDLNPRIVGRTVLHRSGGIRLETVEVSYRDGIFDKKTVFTCPNSVVALPVLRLDGRWFICLTRQFRVPVEAVMVEAPAGTRDRAGESSEDAMLRELEEEIGLTRPTLVLVADHFVSPGRITERMRYYLAIGGVATRRRRGKDAARIEVFFHPLDELDAMLDNIGRYTKDMKTHLLLLELSRYRAKNPRLFT